MLGRRTCLGIVSCLILAGSACSPPEIESPPNVILISVDTLRADHLNAYGYGKRTTSPAIDALAAEGVLFENHIAASPWTTPSHMSLFTALYPTAHGVTQSFREFMASAGDRSFNRLADEQVTLAEHLSREAYATAAFTGGGTMDPALGFDQGFDRYDVSMYRLDDTNLAAMHRWIRDHAGGPFFLFWHTFEVHAPYLATEFLPEVLDAERAAGIEAAHTRMLAELESAPGVHARQALITSASRLLERFGAMDRSVTEALYDGGIRSFDRRFADLVSLLRDLGLYERTMIVLTSDHGEEFADHTRLIYDAHGHTLYDELIRVPLILKLPDRKAAGARVAAVNRNIDVMPTILRVAGVTFDPDTMQGRALQPLWDGSGPGEGRLAYSESLAESYEMKTVRGDRYKYIVAVRAEEVRKHGRTYVPDDPARVELFDLATDPAEKSNLFPQESHGEAAGMLDASLRALAAMPTGRAAQVDLESETIERLRSLGYVR